MPDQVTEQELKDRLSLIETMIAEGRRTTGSWGWTFVLWGVAYYVAIAWTIWGHYPLAWPITMVAASVLTAVLATRRRRSQPRTTMGRAIGSIWVAMGITMFILFFSLGLSGRLVDQQAFVALVAAMLGTSNATSSLILKWKAQFACAIVWWAAAVISCFGTFMQSSIAGVAAIFLCQIAFGIYATIYESSKRGQVVHHA
jgi:phosphatidylglycerophosphate synthase